jgi:ankyrin repeat protein
MKRFLMLCGFLQLLLGEISILDLKNTYRCVQGTENAMLSPLVGAISWHSEWMKNFYYFANPETACAKLAKEIFYYNEGARYFDITGKETAWANVLARKNTADLVISWYINNREKLYELATYKKELAEDVRGYTNKIFKEKRKGWFKESKEEFLRNVSERIPGETPPSNHKLLTRIEHAFYELHQEKSLYPPFVLDQILASYWFGAQNDAASIPGYIELLLGEKCTEELPASYERENLQGIATYTADEIMALWKDAPEKLGVALMLIFKRGNNPPFVRQSTYSCGSRRNIADCVESALHNFFDFILFDGFRYNFDLLPEKIRDTVNPALKSFYSTFPLEETQFHEAGQQWFMLLSDLHQKDENIRYVKEKCEIDGSEANVVRVINALLGTDGKKFLDFSNLLTDNERSVNIDQESGGAYVMTIDDRCARFFFEGYHGRCDFIPPPVKGSSFDVFVQDSSKLTPLFLTLSPAILFTGNYKIDHDYLVLGRDLANLNVLGDIIKSITRILTVETPDQELYCLWIETLLGKLRENERIYRIGLGSIMSAYDDSIALCANKILDNQSISFQELLLIASQQGGSKGFIEYLFGRGIKVNKKDKDGRSALMLAAGSGHTDTVKALLSAKDIAVDEQDGKGKTALMLAAARGYTDTVKALFSAKDIAVDEQDGNGKTALMLAAENGYTDTVKVLLSRGAMANKKDRGGDTAVMLAAGQGYPDTVKVLCDGGALVNEKDEGGKYTALISAADKGHVAIVKVLLEGGALVNEKDKWGRSAFIFAAANGNVEMAKVLLEGGALVNEKDEDGKTALMLAAAHGHKEMVKALLDWGALVNEVDVWGITARMHAEDRGNVVIGEILRIAAEKEEEGKSIA